MHAQLKAQERWVQFDTPGAPVPALLPPGTPTGGDARMDALPSLGQHTEAILLGLDLSIAEIERLRADAAI
jgi:itaconate CoA-transferase